MHRSQAGNNQSVYFYKRLIQDTVPLRQAHLGAVLLSGIQTSHSPHHDTGSHHITADCLLLFLPWSADQDEKRQPIPEAPAASLSSCLPPSIPQLLRSPCALSQTCWLAEGPTPQVINPFLMQVKQVGSLSHRERKELLLGDAPRVMGFNWAHMIPQSWAGSDADLRIQLPVRFTEIQLKNRFFSPSKCSNISIRTCSEGILCAERTLVKWRD